jgi:uracil-DNA glycosylase
MTSLAARIVACERCPRLIAHCRKVAREKRRAYRDEAYWGKPVPPFGVVQPRLLVVGLAPGAHGANQPYGARHPSASISPDGWLADATAR